MYIYIYNTRNYKPTTVRVCVSVKPEREQNVLPISIHSFRILHVVLFFFECIYSFFSQKSDQKRKGKVVILIHLFYYSIH
jgi:hypothetical protein